MKMPQQAASSADQDGVLRDALHLAGYAVFESDDSGVLFWQPQTWTCLGLPEAEIEALSTQTALHEAIGPQALLRQRMMETARARGSSYRLEYQLTRPNGQSVWLEERGCWRKGPKAPRLMAVLRPISERKRREARLEFLTSHDELTGVFNRTRLREELEHKIAESTRSKRHWVYILAGIDELGFVNADYGFDVADQVIAGVARRLGQNLDEDACVGRAAGAKFGLVMGLNTPQDLKTITQHLIAIVREPVIDTSAGPVATSISIGAVWLSEDRPTSEATMAAAESALESARQNGRGSFELATDEVGKQGRRRRNASLAEGLVCALNEGRIHLAYQPIVDAHTRKVRHYEALIRMEDEAGEIRPAGEFIEAAEALGLIHLLDVRALEIALKQLEARPDIHLAVNVSAASVQDVQTADPYLSLIETRPDLAKRLIVELTETSLATDRKRTADFVRRLRTAGARFSIDDFGAGYTSFQNLLAFDVDQVKIDGEFIKDFSQNPQNQTFVRTLVDLAKNFRLETVGEWVDTEEDAQALRDLGLDALQGFYLGKPDLKL